ncbi:MAG TPA: signal peptidase II, partial [Fodinibius sp.]|nr:signal peptidase II [Fodinibius sp.]
TPGYLICMGLILGGALGNIIDRLIMAKIEGYGHILEGRVNDFLYFTYSINGDPVFPYIFNMADVFISTSIILLLLFNRRLLPEPANLETAPST